MDSAGVLADVEAATGTDAFNSIEWIPKDVPVSLLDVARHFQFH